MRYIISLARTSLILCGLAAGAARAEVPDVVTDIPPVHALVSQVMGDLGTPVLLLTKGASEHDFQLRPSQAQSLADAELVVWIGPELTPWLERALAGLSSAATLALLDAPQTARRGYSADGAHMHDDHGAAHRSDEAEHNDHTGVDPHAWLDPQNARVWTGLIAAELGRMDPANAETYLANAAAAQAGIDALDSRVTGLLGPVRERPIVVYHDAYGYFANRFGLSIVGSVALGDATAPGAAKLAALNESVASVGAGCIFPEAQHDAGLALQIAEGTGFAVGGPLDPIGSTLTPGPHAYDALLAGLATQISDCMAAVE